MKKLILRTLLALLAGMVGVVTMPIWPVIFAVIIWNGIDDEIELAFGKLEDWWSGRVKDALAVADQFKGSLDHVLKCLLFAQQKGAGNGK